MITFEDGVFDAFFFEADFCFLLFGTEAASAAEFSPIVIFYRFL